MAEFEVLLQDYQLGPSHKVDSGHECVTIDVSVDETCGCTNSLDHLNHQVADRLSREAGREKPRHIDSATKLYVVGTWSCSFPSNREERDRSVENVCKLIKEMKNLEELTWMSELPFMSSVFDVLLTSPTPLAKLIVDISQPVKVSSDSRAMYINPEDMRPLLKFTNLRELRVFGMRDSLQSIVWESAFRNKAESGLRVLDLRMDEAPLVRKDNWIRAVDVVGLKVSDNDLVAYKGIDGKGVLHHEHGTGEYLDDYCMRKARIASGLDERLPLPLWCLKLDGFVIDRLPLERELSKVVLLTCGANCVDAGLRAPKTQRTSTMNKWGASVNNEATHCFIAWPNWRAIFDNEGQLLDTNGDVVIESEDSSDERFSTPSSSDPAQSPEDVTPLTGESLNLKDLNDALEDGMNFPKVNGSEVATRGSDVPSLSVRSQESEASSARKSDFRGTVGDAEAQSDDTSVHGSSVPPRSVHPEGYSF